MGYNAGHGGPVQAMGHMSRIGGSGGFAVRAEWGALLRELPTEGRAELCTCRVLPLAALADPQPACSLGIPIPGPRLLPPAFSQLLPLSASLSLALRRKVDVRCVHTLWASRVGALCWGWGCSLHVALFPACGFGLPWLPHLQLPKLMPHPQAV